MKLATIENWPGKNYEILGLVKGTVVQSKNLGKDFMAGMKTLVGGEIVGYTEMIVEARAIATKRMVDEAEALDADAVIGVRYGSSSVMQSACRSVIRIWKKAAALMRLPFVLYPGINYLLFSRTMFITPYCSGTANSSLGTTYPAALRM